MTDKTVGPCEKGTTLRARVEDQAWQRYPNSSRAGERDAFIAGAKWAAEAIAADGGE